MPSLVIRLIIINQNWLLRHVQHSALLLFLTNCCIRKKHHIFPIKSNISRRMRVPSHEPTQLPEKRARART